MSVFIRCTILQQLLIILGLSMLWSCQESKVESSEEGITIKIDNSSGDDFSYGTKEALQYFAPYPFNHATIVMENDKYEVMILSKKINRGKTIAVQPLGKMTVSNADKSKTEVIVAVPTNKELQIAEIDDFFDFSVKQFNLKQMVEYWYSNRYGLNGSEIKGWEPVGIDEFIAEN